MERACGINEIMLVVHQYHSNFFSVAMRRGETCLLACLGKSLDAWGIRPLEGILRIKERGS
jgi:hypothetical protein